jgi:hypothetical protein
MKNKLRDKMLKFDGKSRVSTENYRKNYDEIFKKKSQPKKDWWKYMDCAAAPEEDFLDQAEREKKELEESYQESRRQTNERKEKDGS